MARQIATFAAVVGLGLNLACSGSSDNLIAHALHAEVSERITTVVHVTWTTERPSVGYVEYGKTDEFGTATPLETRETTQHAVTLLGLNDDTEYHYRVVTVDGKSRHVSDEHTVRTGNLPGSLPSLTRIGGGHDWYTIVPILGASTAVVILDPQGRIVWYHTDNRALDFYRARLSVDGKSLWYNAASVSGDAADNSELVNVALDGSETRSIAVPLLAHDFVEHPDGTLAAIVVEYRDVDGVSVRGDKIVEITPQGEQSTVFSVWDCFDVATVQGDDLDHGWTFANALDFDPQENAYYLGLRNFSSILKVNRDSGACEWVLGLYGSTFEFAAGSRRFLHQHQFELQGNRLLVMDNEGSAGNESRVLEYELDYQTMVARETWSYVADPSVYTFVLGEPTRLGSGDVLVNWSSAGQIERISSAGDVRWQLNTAVAFVFGFHTIAKTLYASSKTGNDN